MDLVRDLLDTQVVDRNGRLLGRVDKIILECPDHGPVRVTAIEIGLISVSDRVHPFLGRCARAIETILNIDRERPARIPVSKITSVEDPVRIDIAATDTNVLAVEQLVQPIVASIPGAD